MITQGSLASAQQWIDDLADVLTDPSGVDLNRVRYTYDRIRGYLGNNDCRAQEASTHCIAAVMCADPKGRKVHLDAARNIVRTMQVAS